MKERYRGWSVDRQASASCSSKSFERRQPAHPVGGDGVTGDGVQLRLRAGAVQGHRVESQPLLGVPQDRLTERFRVVIEAMHGRESTAAPGRPGAPARRSILWPACLPPEPCPTSSTPAGRRRWSPVEADVTRMGDFLRAEVAAGRGYLPAGDHVLRAFRQPLDDVRVLIVGQDPYPTPGHPGRAVLLGRPRRAAAAAQPGQHLHASCAPTSAMTPPSTGDLTPWTEQGVLLLNRVAHRAPGQPRSHRGKGWETVTGRPSRRWWRAAARSSRSSGVATPSRSARCSAASPGSSRAHPSPLSAHSRVLRVAPVQPGQRPARRAGRRTRRLEVDVTAPASPNPASGPATSPSATRSPRACPTRTRDAGPLRRLGRPARGRPGRYAPDAGQQFGYANLAVRGRLLADIVGPQLDAALALEPDLVSIVGGGNDILRPERRRRRAGRRAGGRGRAHPGDRRRRPHGHAVRPGRARRWCAPPAAGPRIRRAIWGIAQRHGARVLDQWSLVALRDWRMWADDRIHMTAEGHRRVALAALWTLGTPPTSRTGDTAAPAPLRSRAPRARGRATPSGPASTSAPWVQRRLRGESSGDSLSAKRPHLLPPVRPES